MARRSWRGLAAPVVVGTVLVFSVLAAQPSQGADERYLIQAHREHLAEIEAGQAAQQKGQTPAVREQGRRLVADHGRLDAEVQKTAQLLDVSLPTEPTRLQRAQLRRVTGRAGTDFDEAWVELEIRNHREYVEDAEKEAADGSSPYVQVVAREAIPVLRAHLEMLEEIRVGAPQRPASVPAGLAGLAAHRPPQDLGTTAAAAPAAAAPRRPRAQPATRPPVRLRLPAARIDLAVRPVGIRPNGSLRIPKNPATLGWWASGGWPGAGGTVVVVGHVDSRRSGAGPLASLRKVKVSAKVSVTTADGARVPYRVVGRRTYRHDRLPASLFARHGPPRLALITCTGRYDRRDRHYVQALVVYAVPVSR